jgi:hypothetical protein
MWALDVVFSTVWIELLVSGVSRLHALVLGPFGVMFKMCLDLCRASWSSLEVIDELILKVSL